MPRMNQSDTSIRRQNSYLWLCGVVTLLFAGLLVYSQTQALAWDEGFHLLAAQLIKAGKRPYLDFCFPQTPLNAYWNAGWMRILGDSWRVVQAFAALFTAGAIMLAADFIFVRICVPGWRLAAALTAALIIGLNVLIVQFGTVGQAYGMCLFLIVASFRVSILAAERKAAWWAGLAGFLAAAAAGSSLLTAPVSPVVLLWILVYNRIGSRPRKFAAFALATAIALVPLLLLLAKGPRQVIFNIVEYHLFYRSIGWEGAQQDLEVLTSWVNSTQALLLGLLAVAGVLFAVKSRQDRQWREELYLCCWLAVALALFISSAHPTFEAYFVLLVPFLGVLAAVGLYALVSRLDIPLGTQGRQLFPIVVLTALLCLGLARALYERRDDYSWRDLEEIARRVEQVTPPQEVLLADEHIYFLTHHTPPSGMEFPDSQKLNLPPAVAASLHIVSRTELAKRVQAGMFNTVETCDDEDDERILILHLPQVYARKAVIHGCRIFWDRLPAAAFTASGSR